VKCADRGVQARVAEARSSRAAPCSPPTSTMEDYKVIRAIGKGSFGKVYLVRHVSEARQYVMKVIKLKGIPPKERHVAFAASLSSNHPSKWRCHRVALVNSSAHAFPASHQRVTAANPTHHLPDRGRRLGGFLCALQRGVPQRSHAYEAVTAPEHCGVQGLVFCERQGQPLHCDDVLRRRRPGRAVVCEQGHADQRGPDYALVCPGALAILGATGSADRCNVLSSRTTNGFRVDSPTSTGPMASFLVFGGAILDVHTAP